MRASANELAASLHKQAGVNASEVRPPGETKRQQRSRQREREVAGEKEIRNKIRSVKNMQKITKAMEMVAASKIRKAQAQMEASRP